MKKLLSIKFMIIFLLITSNIKAQEVTDFDLGRFAHAYRAMVKLNLDAQQKMAKIIEDEGLTLEEYHAINETLNNTEIEPELPKEDFEKYDKIKSELVKIQKNLESEVDKAYTKNELTRKQYTAISERVKQDRVLQIKLEKIIAEMKK